jgi:hypothetical protein
VRLPLFLLLLGAYWGSAQAQTNELDNQFTPPSNAKFNQVKSKGGGLGLLANKTNDYYLWAIKYNVLPVLKGHHQLGFELSINDWLGIEPQIGVLLNSSDMYTNRFSGESSFFREFIGIRPDNYPVSAVSYPSLLAWAMPRSNAIPSLGMQVNLYAGADRYLPYYGYVLQLGYQFQHMRYTLPETLNNTAVAIDSRGGFMRRQQFSIFAGLQTMIGESFPFIVEYGFVFAYNILSSPTFSRETTPNTNTTYFQKQAYDSAYEPFIGIRIRFGIGYNRQG